MKCWIVTLINTDGRLEIMYETDNREDACRYAKWCAGQVYHREAECCYPWVTGDYDDEA
jgi:hypothetical protein